MRVETLRSIPIVTEHPADFTGLSTSFTAKESLFPQISKETVTGVLWTAAGVYLVYQGVNKMINAESYIDPLLGAALIGIGYICLRNGYRDLTHKSEPRANLELKAA